jgi:hypothetical protein
VAKGEEEALSVVVCFGLRVVEVEVDLICMLLVASCFSLLFSSSETTAHSTNNNDTHCPQRMRQARLPRAATAA